MVVLYPTSWIAGVGLNWPWCMSNVTANLVLMVLLFLVPTWLVASTECRGRKSLAALRDEKAHRLGQVEVFVVLFLVYEVVCLD
jgi:predicted ABC-type sugar transport system permease subunit